MDGILSHGWARVDIMIRMGSGTVSRCGEGSARLLSLALSASYLALGSASASERGGSPSASRRPEASDAPTHGPGPDYMEDADGDWAASHKWSARASGRTAQQRQERSVSDFERRSRDHRSATGPNGRVLMAES
jgi:hypothetical protein